VPVHGWRLYTGAAHLRLDEEPIESCVVGDESVVAESVGEVADDVLKPRRLTNIHAPNPMDALRPEVSSGIHECRPGFSPTIGLDRNDGDLDDSMVVAGMQSRGLHIHHSDWTEVQAIRTPGRSRLDVRCTAPAPEAH
jgi:hypothetical protein